MSTSKSVSLIPLRTSAFRSTRRSAFRSTRPSFSLSQLHCESDAPSRGSHVAQWAVSATFPARPAGPWASQALRVSGSQAGRQLPRCSADLCHSVASQLPNTLDDSVCDARQGDQVRSQFEWAVPRSAQVSTQNVCETGMMRRSASGTVGRPRLSRSGCHRHAQRSAG